MLLTIASGLIFTEIKINVLNLLSSMVKIFWNKWELRGMVLLSLSLQIFLIVLGNRRKYSAKPLIAFFVWSTYLLADWVATVSLSTLVKGQGEIKSVLVVFWTPFLILHLGGPDTITAYALEDNELWIRHLLGLILHVGVALYVYFSSTLIKTPLTFLGIPIFVAGIIKYGERIWILWSASSKQFSKFLLKPKRGIKNHSPSFREPENLDFYLIRKEIIPNARYLHEASLSFKMFIPLFSNLTLRFYKDLEGIIMTLKSKSTTDAFKVVETELEFLYDVLYTKTTILHSQCGSFLRFICFLSYITTIIAFQVDLKIDHAVFGNECQKDDTAIFGKKNCRNVDLDISYLLLFGAFFLDIYGAISYIFSNWAMLWLTNYKNRLTNSVYKVIASLHDFIYGRRESRISMAQHNLIKYCLEAKAAKFDRVEKILDTYNILAKHWHTTWKGVKLDMRDLIYLHILDKYERYRDKKWDFKFLKKLLDERGDHVLEEVYNLHNLSETTSEVEFGHSLLVWHIATDLCYYDDQNKYLDIDQLGTNHKISRLLSNYMLYLLVMRSTMMPKGISEVRYRDSCAEFLRFFQDRKNLDGSKASMFLLDFFDSQTGIPEILGSQPDIPELSDKSVLFDGVRLAKNLQSLVTDSRWDLEEKWKMISLVWVEMLTYAASRCGWKEHCQQLRRGGELLTHVCLMMAHFGLSLQIRLQDSHDSHRKAHWDWESLDRLADYLA